MQINVKGWKTIYSSSNYKLTINGTIAKLVFTLNNESTPIPITFESFGEFTIPSNYRPSAQVSSPAYSGNNILLAVMPNGQIVRRSMTGSKFYCGVWGTIHWIY